MRFLCRWLASSEIDEIIATLTAAHIPYDEQRRLFFQYIDGLLQSYRVYPEPLLQLRSDLHALNRTPAASPQAEPPLAIWLTNAMRLLRSRLLPADVLVDACAVIVRKQSAQAARVWMPGSIQALGSWGYPPFAGTVVGLALLVVAAAVLLADSLAQPMANPMLNLDIPPKHQPPNEVAERFPDCARLSAQDRRAQPPPKDEPIRWLNHCRAVTRNSMCRTSSVRCYW